MPPTRKFLLVDDNPDGRSLLSRTLHRKFPQSLMLECVDADVAARTAKMESLDAAVIHRTAEYSLAEVVSKIREVNPRLPILALSGYDRSREALEAGANQFLNYDKWLLVGTVVAEMLAPTAAAKEIA